MLDAHAFAKENGAKNVTQKQCRISQRDILCSFIRQHCVTIKHESMKSYGTKYTPCGMRTSAKKKLLHKSPRLAQEFVLHIPGSKCGAERIIGKNGFIEGYSKDMWCVGCNGK